MKTRIPDFLISSFDRVYSRKYKHGQLVEGHIPNNYHFPSNLEQVLSENEVVLTYEDLVAAFRAVGNKPIEIGLDPRSASVILTVNGKDPSPALAWMTQCTGSPELTAKILHMCGAAITANCYQWIASA